MNIKDFKAGTWRQGYKYKYFLPEKINQTFIWDDAELNELLERASLRLGELNAFARFIPDVSMFIRMHVLKEAVVSSKIEGTQTTMEDALQDKKEIDPEKRNDWMEVNNYIKAMNQAIDRLETLPLSNRMLKQAHTTLMHSVRGEKKSPGEYRRSQNWIGGASIADAVFVPPVNSEISDLMADMELFLHNETIKVPHLVRIAIAHYQFETIHPFLDGNGRLGRLMISLYLVSNKVMDKPLLYLSDFFERNRVNYYDKLMAVRLKNDLRQWLVFFLVGVVATSEKAIDVLKNIIDLKEKTTKEVMENFGKRANSGLILLDYLYEQPRVHVKDVQQVCKLSPKAANDLIAKMVESAILKEMTSNRRNRVFLFARYLDKFRK